MPPDEKPGESSTPEAINAASDAALGAGDFTRYAEIENAREAGKPLPTKPEAPAPSEPSSEKPAASEPAANEKPIQEKPKPKGAEERKVELDADIQALLRRRAELRAEVEKPIVAAAPGEKKADPPPAPAPAAAAAATAAPKKPLLNDFATHAEWDVANDAYIGELAAFKASEVIRTHDAARELAAANKALAEKWDAQKAEVLAEHADLIEVAFSKDTPITPVMDQWIKSSDQGIRLLYKLGENGSAEGKRIAALAPIPAARALAAIEAAITPAPKPAPVKKHTAAPAPATNLDGRDSEAADPALAALASGDTEAYFRIMNARDRKAAA